LGRACGTIGGGFWREGLTERDNLGDLGVDGRIILKWIFKKWNEGMDGIDLVGDRNRFRAIVDSVINLWVP
jgi:hypothetical protein